MDASSRKQGLSSANPFSAIKKPCRKLTSQSMTQFFQKVQKTCNFYPTMLVGFFLYFYSLMLGEAQSAQMRGWSVTPPDTSNPFLCSRQVYKAILLSRSYLNFLLNIWWKWTVFFVSRYLKPPEGYHNRRLNLNINCNEFNIGTKWGQVESCWDSLMNIYSHKSSVGVEM